MSDDLPVAVLQNQVTISYHRYNESQTNMMIAASKPYDGSVAIMCASATTHIR